MTTVWIAVLVVVFAAFVLAAYSYVIWLHFRCAECRGKLVRTSDKSVHGPMGVIANQLGWWRCERCGKEQLRLADVETMR